MEIFLGWIVLSIVIGVVGAGKEIGGIASFFISILLSPLIGFIVILVSKNKETASFEQQTLINQQKQLNALNSASIPDELSKLAKLKEDNIISEEEFIKLKDKLLSGANLTNTSTTEKYTTDTTCSGCGKLYYVGKDKCPYCNVINVNKVNPYKAKASDVSSSF
jgi:hypothetical protein